MKWASYGFRLFGGFFACFKVTAACHTENKLNPVLSVMKSNNKRVKKNT